MRLAITPWTDASSPESPPANGDWLRLSPPHLRPRHRQSSLLEHARTFLDRATPHHRCAGRGASKAESHSQATRTQTQFLLRRRKFMSCRTCCCKKLSLIFALLALVVLAAPALAPVSY